MKTNLYLIKKIAVIIFKLAIFSPTLSMNWYVDNQADGSNNGTSWLNAWNSFSYITGVKAGDTLYISGGSLSKTYYESLTLGTSGSDGNPVVIKVGQESGHNGTVVIDGQDSSNNCIYIFNYTTIDGEVNGQIRLRCENSFQDGIYSQRNSQNITIKYVEVKNCGKDRKYDGIELLQPQDCVIEYCLIHGNYQNGLKMTGSRGSWGSNIIRYNEITNNCDDGISGRNGLDIYENKIHHQGIFCSTGHPDGIQTMGNYVRIFNNEIYDNFTQQIILSFDNPNSGHIQIFNNVIYQTDDTNIKAKFARGINVRSTRKCKTIEDVIITNNTFVDLNFSGILVKVNRGSIISNRYPIIIKNNIIYNCHLNGRAKKNGIFIGKTGNYDKNSIIIDYNLLNNGQFGASLIKWKENNYSNKEFAEKGLGQQHGQTGDPYFVTYSQYGNDNNFRLKQNSPAIGNGIDLSMYYTIDFNERIRDDKWDIGAFKF